MLARPDQPDPAADLLALTAGRRFRTLLADTLWRFLNATGKVALEHRRLAARAAQRYSRYLHVPTN